MNNHIMDTEINGLEKAKEILSNIENSIENLRQIWIQIRDLNPDFEQVSEEAWEEKSSHCWLHGATKVNECSLKIFLIT